MSTPATHVRHEPGGTLFWLSALAGWALIGYGIRGLWQHQIDTNPRDLAWFAFGGAVLHDVLFAPLVLLAGVAVARAVPGRLRAFVQAALIISGTIALFSYPLVRGYGRSLHNPSALPHSYATDLLLVLGIVWGVTSFLAALLLRPHSDR